MKTVPLLPLLLLPALLLPATHAQTVYESRDGRSKVYSDRPLPGGRAVELRPLTVIEPLPVVPAAREPAVPEVAPVPLYRSLAIVFPEEDGSVAANHATFEVRVAVDPPLQIAKGHAFSLRLDGRSVPGRYTGTDMMIPPEFFGDVAPAGVQRHVLEAWVVDADGRQLLAAPPVAFQTRFVTVLQRPRPPHLQVPIHGTPPALTPPEMRRRPADLGKGRRIEPER